MSEEIVAYGKHYEFEQLLIRLVKELEILVDLKPDISDYQGTKLESLVYEILLEISIGTLFENKIEHLGGLKFPDIIIDGIYGLEIKTSQKSNWTTVGNSIFEGTRHKGVESIYLLFGQFSSEIEFQIRPYQDCLSEIVVTHSPRYLIDMNLAQDKGILSEINLDYNSFRSNPNSFELVKSHYHSKLGPGERLWWSNSENAEKASKPILKSWHDLTTSEKTDLKLLGIVLFPEIFSQASSKYFNLTLWLLIEESIICPNIRDIYSAGGTMNFNFENIELSGIPKKEYYLLKNFERLTTVIASLDNFLIYEHWGINPADKSKVGIWLGLVSPYLRSDVKNVLYQKSGIMSKS